MTQPLFSKITIIGLGLIGSSIARGARQKNLAATIVGCDANDISLAFAMKKKFIDAATSDLSEAVKSAQLVILATPPSTLERIAEAIAPHLQPGAIVMDVCSVKEPVMAAIMAQLPPGVDFIPAHPIAGSEQSGAQAGKADLFAHKRVIVTPEEPLENEALQKTMAFWQGLGARVEAMPAHLHDMVYAHVSHLPQLLAFAAAGPLATYKDDERLQKFLRLIHSSAALWIEIFLMNKENIIKALDRYLDVISHVKNELAAAPEPSTEGDGMVTRTILFPRIAASCLITTVMEAEKRAGFPFGRYAGGGFADFTDPAALPPEGDIERISGQYAPVAAVLDEYVGRLQTLRAALVGGEDALKKALAGAD